MRSEPPAEANIDPNIVGNVIDLISQTAAVITAITVTIIIFLNTAVLCRVAADWTTSALVSIASVTLCSLSRRALNLFPTLAVYSKAGAKPLLTN